MHWLVAELKPERWKVFQMLPIEGENDAAPDLQVTSDQFCAFLGRHADLDPVGEDNEAMTESYVMLDPLGRFFQNSAGRYQYTPPILEVGVVEALQGVGWDRGKFLERGGLYGWARSGLPEGEEMTALKPEGETRVW